MKKKDKQVGFNLVKITTEQYAVFEENFDGNKEIQMKTDLKFGLDPQKKLIAIFPAFTLITADKPFLKIETACHFKVIEEAWESMCVENENSLKIPVVFIRHLTVIAISTARGILHSKSENTEFNKYFIPLINVEELIKDDVVISLDN